MMSKVTGKNKMEVYTTNDKAKRDELFQALRNSTDPFERQAVKFSGFELVTVTPVDGATGPLIRIVRYPSPKGPYAGREQQRPVFRSTWSVAHPKDPRS